ncbi:hypothetical protein [Flammeovirga aprica]|uniref:Lipoprotein n=1 Tax=Flammeovirga aprica JL-4 TaxID=694437 RepID=A0A7X9XC42_9BACT|nr:hypothetical protein [Flammeovirga aprica]NME71249.1 hypothetical protein [Flammeovirga aprica JL-4]
MKNIITIFLLSFIYSCKEKPNYNPFDNQFNVSVKQLINDNCDTVSAGCGYFNLLKSEDKLKPYYQVYCDDFFTVIAKGFTMDIDTFKLQSSDFQNSYIDSITSLPLDKSQLNIELGKFGYKIFLRETNTIKAVNKEIQDTVSLKLYTCPIEDQNLLVRTIEFFKGRE